MKNIFISIIIPAYNAASFLPRTIRSIVSQDFLDYELIIVNDGSVDDTLNICKEWERKHEQIIVIDKRNEGVSIARNTALDKATGKYILFVDSDDILFTNALPSIYESLVKNPVDYLRYEFQLIDENDAQLYPNYEARERKKYAYKNIGNTECIRKIVRGEFFTPTSAFRREIIENNRLRFKEGCTYNEDTLFISQYLSFAKSCCYLPLVLYGYRKIGTAVTARFTRKNFDDILGVFYDLAHLAEDQDAGYALELRKTAQSLALHLYERRKMAEDEAVCNEVFEICMRNPLLFEWRTLNIFGTRAMVLWKIKNVVKKVIRRL